MTPKHGTRHCNAFTLIEILIVVVILGILAAMVIPQFADATQQSQISTIKSTLQTLRGQVELYRVQHDGVMPASLNDLVTADPSYIHRNPNDTVPTGFQYDYDDATPPYVTASCTAENANCPAGIADW